MIAANVRGRAIPAAASRSRRRIRVHDRPPEAKYADLLEFLKEFKLRLPPWAKVQPKDFTNLLKKIRERPDAALLESVLLRSQILAVYAPDNIGHFGLALEAYAPLHLADPPLSRPAACIARSSTRWPAGKPDDVHAIRRTRWRRCALQCSETRAPRRRGRARGRRALPRARGWNSTSAASSTASISGVTSFGLFVELDDSKVNGLVHVTQLPHDYLPLRSDAQDADRRTHAAWRSASATRCGSWCCKASVEDRGSTSSWCCRRGAGTEKEEGLGRMSKHHEQEGQLDRRHQRGGLGARTRCRATCAKC